MPEMTALVRGENDDPLVITDDELNERHGPFDPGDEITVADLLSDGLGARPVVYDMYSGFSMLAAVHALQRIQAGDDPVETATRALEELATSGDFEEHFVDLHPEVVQKGAPSRPWFTVAPVKRMDHMSGYEWAA